MLPIMEPSIEERARMASVIGAHVDGYASGVRVEGVNWDESVPMASRGLGYVAECLIHIERMNNLTMTSTSIGREVIDPELERNIRRAVTDIRGLVGQSEYEPHVVDKAISYLEAQLA